MPIERAAFRLTSVSSISTQRLARTPSRATTRRSMRASGFGRSAPNIDMSSIVMTASKKAASRSVLSTRIA